MANPAASDGEIRRKWNLRQGHYLGEISALYFLPLPSTVSATPLLLVGTGSQLLVYDVQSGNLLSCFHVFEGIRVHGISLCSREATALTFSVVVFGERKVKIVSLLVEAEPLSVKVDGVVGLPGFDHWVLDARLLKEDGCLAVGLSDNSIMLLWEFQKYNVAYRVKSSEKCLLYSMRMWGDSIEALRVASGTIYNEIIVWKLKSTQLTKEICNLSQSQLRVGCTKCNDAHFTGGNICRLIGHEGSIFRITWSPDGSNLLSVSDDRSARIWVVTGQRNDPENSADTPVCHLSEKLSLFGHNARIWDCHLTHSIAITAGEDCTCRLWGEDGVELLTLKEHIGRGIWRCLYDEKSSLLITAGFDSAIKVHSLPTLFGETSHQNSISIDLKENEETFTIFPPNLPQQLCQQDSKSEYVRCLSFTRENILYVATNNGILHHVVLSNPDNVNWSNLGCITEKGPIICMDTLVLSSYESSLNCENLVAVGDGRGNATVVRIIIDNLTPKVLSCFCWPAEHDRQLLEIFWCHSLGQSRILTSNPRGSLKLWDISNGFQSGFDNPGVAVKVSLMAVFSSCFGTRIMCLDGSIREKILVCGDQRGNLSIFPLLDNARAGNSHESTNISSIDQFKGAHGITCVTSIAISESNLKQLDIHTTGGDGCICYFRLDKNLQILEFMGMKQVKELGTIQAALTSSTFESGLSRHKYAIGFTSVDFIIWNLYEETKIVQIPCGGWRRPYSYYLGAIPEYQSCFAYLKDQIIHIHRLWMPEHEKGKLLPKVLHMQFHGREIHSLCFLNFEGNCSLNKNCNSWIVTGCEDGTVRLTRYTPSHIKRSYETTLLGEHISGSSVRSICLSSRTYLVKAGQWCNNDTEQLSQSSSDMKKDYFLLFSVGAKQVLTAWLMHDKFSGNGEHFGNEHAKSGHISCSTTENSPSVSFQWFSNHIPSKLANPAHKDGCLDTCSTHACETYRKQESDSAHWGHDDNDWRYMAVTAFKVKHSDSRLVVCFIVVACSDASLTLRALLLPYRLWFDVASLVPQVSPVLALQHLVLPFFSQSKGETKDVHLIISGSTNGNITFWDVSDTVACFMEFISRIQPARFADTQKRPRTGRGSQGGRWWRSQPWPRGRFKDSLKMPNDVMKNNCWSDKTACGSVSIKDGDSCDIEATNGTAPSISVSEKSPIPTFEICEVRPLSVLNSIHQSGVNCLHVSEVKGCGSRQPESIFACCVVSGGDDQAVHCLVFELELHPGNMVSIQRKSPDLTSHVHNGSGPCFHDQLSLNKCRLRVIFQNTVPSAHSSAVKGIWTDGLWIFSTGLDQRVRCWKIDPDCVITEHAHIVISVPEPEALDAIISGRNKYQIAVAGRGMQVVFFSDS